MRVEEKGDLTREDFVYLNGALLEEGEAKVSLLDRGYLYGDAVFETMRVYGGRVFRLREHLERLACSARSVLLSLPLSPGEMEKAIGELVKANRATEGSVRISISRGWGPIGLDWEGCGKPTIAIVAHPGKGYPTRNYEKGVSLVTVAVDRGSPSSVLSRVKSANFLAAILARQEAKARGGFEAVLLNPQGLVVEGTVSSIFIVREGKLIYAA